MTCVLPVSIPSWHGPTRSALPAGPPRDGPSSRETGRRPCSGRAGFPEPTPIREFPQSRVPFLELGNRQLDASGPRWVLVRDE